MKQERAFEILKNGHNVFLTGPAGSGKTFLLNRYIDYVRSKGLNLAITASTGIAATHINGRTIHSWSGIGVRDKLDLREAKYLLRKPYLKKGLERVDVLIIDEISMLNSFRLDMVDFLCKLAKNNKMPFGGIQVVLAGDFFQLPPISSDSKLDFVYNSRVWGEMDLRICYLKEQYRQKDSELLSILNSLRSSNFNLDLKSLLLSRLNKNVESEDKIVKLFSHNIDVDFFNKKELDKINSREFSYNMISSGDKNLSGFLSKSCLAPEKLFLKKGAFVMFVKNKFEAGEMIYANGSSGVVDDFNDEGLPIVSLESGRRILLEMESWSIEDDDGKVLAQISQIPLRLAWAITIHKSQGMTLDSAEIDLSKSFGFGMAYVALSRLKSLNGLNLLGLSESAFNFSSEILEYEKKLINLSDFNIINNDPKRYKGQINLI